MKRNLHFQYLVIILSISSCSTIEKNYKHSFSDGYYKSKIFNDNQKRVYIENKNDSILVYAIDENNKASTTLKKVVSLMPEEQKNINMNSLVFNHLSADIDLLTILSKYRIETEQVAGQLNTNLNGAFYFGLRNDRYQLIYPKSPLNTYKRQIRHYGFSFGLLTGLGGTSINPWVTNNQISYEYDGAVWSKGFAGIIGINNASIGLTIGWDHLLDNNKKYWIYHGKPWLGIAIGLSLN